MQECIFNQALDATCYGTEQGGNIHIQLFKPTYANSQYQQCTAATTNVLFKSQITLTSYLEPTPHPTLGPLSNDKYSVCSSNESIIEKLLVYLGFVVSFSVIGLAVSKLRQKSAVVLPFSPILIVGEMGIPTRYLLLLPYHYY